MTATETSSSRTLSIENAVVTIRAIRVDNKPMTVSVYNQMPAIRVNGSDLGDHADVDLLGVVNRSHAGCDDPCTHVFATKASEPVVLHVRSRARELRWAADDMERTASKYRPDRRGQSIPVWVGRVEEHMPPRPRYKAETFQADNDAWVRRCRDILTDHVTRESSTARALAALDDQLHAELITPLRQVYVAA